MWKLTKAGILYYWQLFLGLYIVLLVVAVLNALQGGMEDDLARIMYLTVCMIGAVTGNEVTKHKLNRFEALLPLPIRKIAAAGHAIWIGYWMSIVLIYAVSCYFSNSGNLTWNFFWQVIALTGAVNGFVFCMGLFFDIKYIIIVPFAKNILSGIALFLACLSGFLYLASVSNALDDQNVSLIPFLISPAGALLLLSFAVGAMFMYFWVFANRKSYTE